MKKCFLYVSDKSKRPKLFFVTVTQFEWFTKIFSFIDKQNVSHYLVGMAFQLYFDLTVQFNVM